MAMDSTPSHPELQAQFPYLPAACVAFAEFGSGKSGK
jgi:hypothetical protein